MILILFSSIIPSKVFLYFSTNISAFKLSKLIISDASNLIKSALVPFTVLIRGLISSLNFLVFHDS